MSTFVVGPYWLAVRATCPTLSKKQYTEQDIQTAIAYFKSAIDKDPAYAQAYAGLADAGISTWGNPSWGGGSPRVLV